MKILTKKTNADSFRQLNFGKFGGDKIEQEQNLTKAQRKQKLKTLRERLDNKDYMEYTIDAIASESADAHMKSKNN